MPRTIEIREIDGRNFEIGYLDLKKSRETLVRLMKIAAPALAEFSGGADKDASAAAGLRSLVETVKYEDLEWLVMTFSKVSKVELEGGVKVDVTDAIFNGELKTQLTWLWECVEVNFGTFLGERAGTALRNFKAKVS